MIPIVYIFVAITIIASNSDNFKITEAKSFPVACKPQSQVSFDGGNLGLLLMTALDDIT